MRKIEKRINIKRNKGYFEEMKLRNTTWTEREQQNVQLVKYIRKEFKPYTSACRDSIGMI